MSRGPRAAPPREGGGEPRRDPARSPEPARRPASHGNAVSHPPRSSGSGPPSIRQDCSAWEGGRSRARLHAPAACPCRNRNGQANPRKRARVPHGPRPKTTSEPERYGGHTVHGQSDVQNTRFVACPGKAEGRTEARRPPAPLPPRPRRPVQRHTGRPPPLPAHPPARERPGRAGPAKGGAHSPKPGRGETGPPPPKGQTEKTGTVAGSAEGYGPSGTALPAPGIGTAQSVRTTAAGGGTGGARTPRERERTHTQGTRGEYQKGNKTKPAERTDRVE